MKLFKLLSIVSAVALFGCAPVQHASSVSHESAATTPAKPAPAAVDPSLVGGPFWSMNLEAPVLWTKDKLTVGSSGDEARTELFASTEEPRVYLEVLVGDHTEEDTAFIQAILKVMSTSENLKLVKAKIVRTASGEVAALVLTALTKEAEPELVFRLITSKEGHGFVVACGGVAPKDLEKAAALCMGTMKTFTLKAAPPAPKGKPKMPASTPLSTQTFKDLSL